MATGWRTWAPEPTFRARGSMPKTVAWAVILALLTDGLPEVEDANDEQFGLDMAQHCGVDPNLSRSTGGPPPGDAVESSHARSHNQSRHSPSACARTSWPASERSGPHNRRPEQIACCRGDDATGPHTVAVCPSRKSAWPGIACPDARRQALLRCSFRSPESLATRSPARRPGPPLFPYAVFS